MKRINDNEISLTQYEFDAIQSFIRDSLYYEWDRYTDKFLSEKTQEVGMRQMNPAMYDMATEMMKLQ